MHVGVKQAMHVGIMIRVDYLVVDSMVVKSNYLVFEIHSSVGHQICIDVDELYSEVIRRDVLSQEVVHARDVRHLAV